jgi:hypothetical protein
VLGRCGVAIAVSLLATTPVLATGCGSSDSSLSVEVTDAEATATAKKPPPDEFAREANRVCKRGHDLIRSQVPDFEQERGIKAQSSLTPSQEEEFIKYVAVPGVQGQVDEISQLPVPPGYEDQVQALLDGLQAVVDSGSDKPASILAAAPGGPLAEVNAIAKSYGVKECEQP